MSHIPSFLLCYKNKFLQQPRHSHHDCDEFVLLFHSGGGTKTPQHQILATAPYFGVVFLCVFLFGYVDRVEEVLNKVGRYRGMENSCERV